MKTIVVVDPDQPAGVRVLRISDRQARRVRDILGDDSASPQDKAEVLVSVLDWADPAFEVLVLNWEAMALVHTEDVS